MVYYYVKIVRNWGYIMFMLKINLIYFIVVIMIIWRFNYG